MLLFHSSRSCSCLFQRVSMSSRIENCLSNSPVFLTPDSLSISLIYLLSCLIRSCSCTCMAFRSDSSLASCLIRYCSCLYCSSASLKVAFAKSWSTLRIQNCTDIDCVLLIFQSFAYHMSWYCQDISVPLIQNSMISILFLYFIVSPSYGFGL